LGVVLSACGYSHPVASVSRFDEARVPERITGHSSFSSMAANYLVRPDSGERQVLRQFLHELQLARHLIDEAYARRDDRGRVRVDYTRLSLEFDQILLGLRHTLNATETAPRDAQAIRGEYRLYE